MRYVIKGKDGYFTGFKVLASHPITFQGQFVGTENECEPEFEALRPAQALKFDSKADAEARVLNEAPLMANQKHPFGGPDAFAGCVVEETDT